MTIDRTKQWWVGTEPDEIREYLNHHVSPHAVIHEFRLATCGCGSPTFTLVVDDTQGAAQRTCTSCGTSHLICDSAEYWAAASPEECACPCGHEAFNIAVGFVLYPDDHEIKWLYVGCRCTKCGILGCYTDWKVAYAPSRHLLEGA